MINMSRWTLHSILFFFLVCKSTGQSGFYLVAPNLLRTDSQENIYLEAKGLSDPIQVSISIQDFSKSTMLLQDSAVLNQENGYRTLKSIQLPSDLLNRDEKRNKFVYLSVNFGNLHTEERTLMVTFHSGYIFIQTDKPIYNPGDTIRFRAFVSSPSFKAFDSSITIDIQSPDGVVVSQISRTRAADGVFKDTFSLSEYSKEGVWKVIAKFDHWQQNTFTYNFVVKKYVLPAFNVTLTPKKPFLNLDDTELGVEVSARYLYGEPVQGTAYVVFGVKMNNEMIRLPSVKQISDLDGGVVTLSMEEIKRAYPNIRSLVGNSVYVKASVLTKSGSDLVEAEKTGIKIVESPFVLSFKDMPANYKPGLPFDFTIQVSQHDGSPARNVAVKVNMLDTDLRLIVSNTARVTLNMPITARQYTISAETTQDGLRPEQQAKCIEAVHPYHSVNHRDWNYLYISTGTNRVSVGDQLSLKLTIATANANSRHLIKHTNYLVLNKGKIIMAERLDVADQTVTSVGLMITPEMLPSFRFVAYYITGSLEVVPDSIWVDVVDSCVGGLSVGPADGIHRDYRPGQTLNLKVRGDPGAKVSMFGVDNAVFLLNKDKLTQRKLWDVVEHRDIGCTHGGGRNPDAVFTDAGLAFSSSNGFRTGNREELQCPGRTRRRRSAEQLKRKAQLEDYYKEKLQSRCCKDGLREIPMPYSCTRRSLYITEGWECIKAFRYCCGTYRNQEISTEIPTVPPPLTTPAPTTPAPPRRPLRPVDIMPYSRTPMLRTHSGWGQTLRKETSIKPVVVLSTASKTVKEDVIIKAKESVATEKAEEAEEYEYEEDWEYLDESEVSLRSKFYESWWMEVDLPTETDEEGFASTTLIQPLPHSITEWGLLAVSSSAHTGFCVAEPYNVKAWKDFFVDLRLPYSVARNEQVEIKAVIHNYGYEELHVRVVLMKTEGMCSIAFKDRHTQELDLAPSSSVVVRYTIVPLVVGKLPLEIMVVGRDLMGGDRIQKTLRVVMDGVQKTEVRSAMLNPAAEGGAQIVRMDKIDLKSVVPNSVPETFINIRGNVLADSIDNSLTDDSLASLIRMPGGCVEQNLASMTLPVIATLYLDRTNNWESVGVQRKNEAIRYIRRGYENQLAYRRSDGSYPPYRREGASTWITAYVVKVFSMAHSIIGINEQHICEPLLYLVKNKHNRLSGKFREDNPVYSTTMTGGLRGDDPEITLTAFVLIALAEAKQAGIRCSAPNYNPEMVIRKTADYLKKSLLHKGRRPYTVAISSYALALLRDLRYNPTDILLRESQDGHWPDKKNRLFSLEATGYALLALVRMERMAEASAAFKWLNSQRKMGGGYGSTQSTMVVLQALSAYLVRLPPPSDLSLNVDVRLPGRQEIRYHFNPTTAYAARSSRLPTNLGLEVEARGNGQGILEVVTYYNQLHEVDEKMPCEHFDLNVTIEESSEKPPVDVVKSYQITIKVRALGPADVRMVVLDISLPTGFTPENSDLEMLSNSVDRYINNFKIVDNLSDRGSLILHLFKVSHKVPEILIFRLQQSFKVGLLQPSSVTVYEYYTPDHRCSRTYNPREDREELSQICTDNVCRCTQGDCCISKTETENFPNKERETFACRNLHHVFQVKVLNVEQSYYDKYEMEITQVIKLGEEAGVEVGQKRFFMSHGGCREDLNIKEGSQYLIMGPKEDQWNMDDETNKFIYMLGKDTWVERWPSSAECSGDVSQQAKCKSLDDTAYDLSVNGCRL